MNSKTIRFLQVNIVLLFCFILLFAGRCNRGLRAIEKEKAAKAASAARTKNLFKIVQGIKFTEVRRRFNNGLSFSNVGYQLVPEWKISFPSIDSVNIYSPRKGHFLNAPVVFDHDSVFNVAWAWLKLKYLNKDSMQFQVLHVHDNVIQDEKTQVFMTFYANDYIKNVLHTDTNKLWAPGAKDTAYIKSKIALTQQHIDSAFAGTTPAVLKAKSPLIKIKKEEVPVDDVDGGKSYDNYLSPTYDVTIYKAYDNFNYPYTAYVDEKGTIIFRKSGQLMSPEFEKSMIEAMKGITDGYLKLYLDVKPAKTLGIPHASIIFLNVTGVKK